MGGQEVLFKGMMFKVKKNWLIIWRVTARQAVSGWGNLSWESACCISEDGERAVSGSGMETEKGCGIE